MMLIELKKQREQALAKADGFLAAVERQNRKFTNDEQRMFDETMAEVNGLDAKIRSLEKVNSIRQLNTVDLFSAGSRPPGAGAHIAKPQPKTLTTEYVADFFKLIQTGGTEMGAALYEGSNGAGGFAVPVVVDQQIVPLAPNETGIRRLATILPTSMDVKIPIKATKGTAAAKAESGGSNNAFGGTSPTLSQKTLTAYMAGDILDVSWEALQDITFFGAFATDDIINAVLEYEEPKFISGSGSGEPEGVLTGADTTTAVSGVTLDGIYDLVATLNAVYHPGASFLMNRVISLLIRKLQRQANLFEPVWTRVGNQDYLLGYPVEYSSAMTSDGSTAAGKPIVFGDFKRGYVIGDRGGSGINVKVLDQPKANLGITQLLAYRRTDGRVRRSEALKAYVLA